MAKEFISALAARGRPRRHKGRIPFNAEVARKVGVGTGERYVGFFLKHHIAGALKIATIRVGVALEDQSRIFGNRHDPARAEPRCVGHREGMAVRERYAPRVTVFPGNGGRRSCVIGSAKRYVRFSNTREIGSIFEIQRTERHVVTGNVHAGTVDDVEFLRSSEAQRISERYRSCIDIRGTGVVVATGNSNVSATIRDRARHVAVVRNRRRKGQIIARRTFSGLNDKAFVVGKCQLQLIHFVFKTDRLVNSVMNDTAVFPDTLPGHVRSDSIFSVPNFGGVKTFSVEPDIRYVTLKGAVVNERLSVRVVVRFQNVEGRTDFSAHGERTAVGNVEISDVKHVIARTGARSGERRIGEAQIAAVEDKFVQRIRLTRTARGGTDSQVGVIAERNTRRLSENLVVDVIIDRIKGSRHVLELDVDVSEVVSEVGRLIRKVKFRVCRFSCGRSVLTVNDELGRTVSGRGFVGNGIADLNQSVRSRVVKREGRTITERNGARTRDIADRLTQTVLQVHGSRPVNLQELGFAECVVNGERYLGSVAHIGGPGIGIAFRVLFARHENISAREDDVARPRHQGVERGVVHAVRIEREPVVVTRPLEINAADAVGHVDRIAVFVIEELAVTASIELRDEFRISALNDVLIVVFVRIGKGFVRAQIPHIAIEPRHARDDVKRENAAAREERSARQPVLIAIARRRFIFSEGDRGFGVNGERPVAVQMNLTGSVVDVPEVEFAARERQTPDVLRRFAVGGENRAGADGNVELVRDCQVIGVVAVGELIAHVPEFKPRTRSQIGLICCKREGIVRRRQIHLQRPRTGDVVRKDNVLVIQDLNQRIFAKQRDAA